MTGRQRGLFVGLSTLDLIHYVGRELEVDAKIISAKSLITAGGPAANAAISFAGLGGAATLLTALGAHPLAITVRAEFDLSRIRLIDLAAQSVQVPSLASVLVEQETGHRTVIAAKAQWPTEVEGRTPEELRVEDYAVILVDGHHMTTAIDVAQRAAEFEVPVVMDCGSWKPRTEELLPYVDFALCSADFVAPNGDGVDAVFNFISSLGVEKIAITRGPEPILYQDYGVRDQLLIPAVQAIDTLAAGDIFHGAFCWFTGDGAPFTEALRQASTIASRSCEFLGPREWMQRRA